MPIWNRSCVRSRLSRVVGDGVDVLREQGPLLGDLAATPNVESRPSLVSLLRSSRRAVPFQRGLRVYSIAPVTAAVSALSWAGENVNPLQARARANAAGDRPVVAQADGRFGLAFAQRVADAVLAEHPVVLHVARVEAEHRRVPALGRVERSTGRSAK